jgi:peptidyl-prolyl cis-trans isomerase SurA
MLRIYPGLLLAAFSLSATLAQAATPTTPAVKTPPPPSRAVATHGEPMDRVVAVVNDGVVLESELETETNDVSARLRGEKVQLPSNDVLREQVLDRLVLEEIQAQRADRAGIHVTDEQVNAALEDIARRNKVDLAHLPEKLAEQGFVYADYRNNLRREIQREMLRARDVVQRINISPRELDEFLALQKHTATADNEYNVSHILIAVAQDATPEQLEKAHQKALDVLARANKGEAFNQLAVAYSDSQTALEGGALGWRKGPQLPTFLADVVARLKPGQVSDLIQTSSGYHLVRLNDLRSTDGPHIIQQVHLRHILIKTNDLEDDATVKQKLNAMRTRILNGESFGVVAKASSEDTGSAINGGDLGWAKLEVYDPDFAAAAAKLQVDEISEPVKSRFGWHIIQMLGSRDFDNTESAVREKAFEQLRDSRVDEATEIWLRQIRDEAYVETRL